jgi:hypothetical protein
MFNITRTGGACQQTLTGIACCGEDRLGKVDVFHAPGSWGMVSLQGLCGGWNETHFVGHWQKHADLAGVQQPEPLTDNPFFSGG